ncbi:MAG TPA: TrbI/VirB10 family protein [Phenylobacterium sp.]
MTEVAKGPPPPLNVRAVRPVAVRLRGSAVKIVLAAAALVLSGAFIYAFILKPAARADDRGRAAPEKTSGAVHPAELISGQPASYDKLAGSTGEVLPPPRTQPDAPAPIEPRPAPVRPTAPSGAHAEHAFQVRNAALQSGLFFQPSRPNASSKGDAEGAPAERSASVPFSGRGDYAAAYGRHRLVAPLSPYEIKAGTLIPAALLTAIDTSRPGPVVAVTTQPVYDTVSGRAVLIPQGARLLGAQTGDSAYGEKRAFLVWKRLILPNGKSILLDDELAADAQGTVGISGQADRRLPQLGAGIALSGAITTLGEFARGGGRGRRTGLREMLGSATADQAVELGGRLIDRELEVQPRITVASGAPVQVIVTKDLILEPLP